MSIEQLVRETFREHADHVETVPAGLSALARQQADNNRSRRRATVVAAGLVVVAIFSVLAVNPFNRADDDIEPVDQLPTVRIPPGFAGRTLIESAETAEGRTLELTATATGGSQWQVLCTGVGSRYVVHYSLDGVLADQAPCSPFAGLGESPAPGFEPPGYRIPTGASSGERRTLRAWLTEADGAAVVHPSEAILVAAVYAMPPPVAVLAGFEVLPIEPALGQEWSVVQYDGSEPGDGSLTVELDHPQQTILQLMATGSGTGAVRLVVDGVPITTDPPLYPLGSVNIGDLLSPGAHTVTLRIEGSVPADARLGIAQRERVL